MRSFYKANVRPAPTEQAVKLVSAEADDGLDVLDYYLSSRRIANDSTGFDNAWIIITSNAVRDSVEIYDHNRKFLSGRRIGKQKHASLHIEGDGVVIFARSSNPRSSYCISLQLGPDRKVASMYYHYDELDKSSVRAIHTLANKFKAR